MLVIALNVVVVSQGETSEKFCQVHAPLESLYLIELGYSSIRMSRNLTFSATSSAFSLAIIASAASRIARRTRRSIR